MELPLQVAQLAGRCRARAAAAGEQLWCTTGVVYSLDQAAAQRLQAASLGKVLQNVCVVRRASMGKYHV